LNRVKNTPFFTTKRHFLPFFTTFVEKFDVFNSVNLLLININLGKQVLQFAYLTSFSRQLKLSGGNFNRYKLETGY
jgi:hypothetical protein